MILTLVCHSVFDQSDLPALQTLETNSHAKVNKSNICLQIPTMEKHMGLSFKTFVYFMSITIRHITSQNTQNS